MAWHEFVEADDIEVAQGNKTSRPMENKHRKQGNA